MNSSVLGRHIDHVAYRNSYLRRQYRRRGELACVFDDVAWPLNRQRHEHFAISCSPRVVGGEPSKEINGAGAISKAMV